MRVLRGTWRGCVLRRRPVHGLLCPRALIRRGIRGIVVVGVDVERLPLTVAAVRTPLATATLRRGLALVFLVLLPEREGLGDAFPHAVALPIDHRP